MYKWAKNLRDIVVQPPSDVILEAIIHHDRSMSFGAFLLIYQNLDRAHPQEI